jgi:hypothetical protein
MSFVWNFIKYSCRGGMLVNHAPKCSELTELLENNIPYRRPNLIYAGNESEHVIYRKVIYAGNEFFRNFIKYSCRGGMIMNYAPKCAELTELFVNSIGGINIPGQYFPKKC